MFTERRERKLSPENLSEFQELMAFDLWEHQAITFRSVRLSHQKEGDQDSPVYINIRTIVRRNLHMRSLITEAFQELLKPVKPSLIGEIPFAIQPVTEQLSDKLHLGLLTPVSQTKDHGLGDSEMGLKKGDQRRKVVIIDDVLTFGGSIKKVAEIFRIQGLNVHDAAVLVDREQGGTEFLEQMGIRVHSFLKLTNMLDFYLRKHFIQPETSALVKDYLSRHKAI